MLSHCGDSQAAHIVQLSPLGKERKSIFIRAMLLNIVEGIQGFDLEGGKDNRIRQIDHLEKKIIQILITKKIVNAIKQGYMSLDY